MKVFVPIYYDGVHIDLIRPVSGTARCLGYVKNVALSREGLYITNHPCHRVAGIIVEVPEGVAVQGVEELYPDVVTPLCSGAERLYAPRFPAYIAPLSLRVELVGFDDETVSRLVDLMKSYEIEVDETSEAEIRQILRHIRVAVAV